MKAEKVNVGTPVRDEEEEPVKVKTKPKAQEVKAKTVYLVKCIWTGPVKVLATNTPSGAAYSFQPGQIQEVASRADQRYLVNLGLDKPGCCSGSGTPRIYFELA